MKKFLYFNCFVIFLSLSAFAQEASKSYKQKISEAVNLIKSGKKIEAAQQLLALSKVTTIDAEKAQVKYLLGLSLMELNLNQTAAFQFVEVIRSGNTT